VIAAAGAIGAAVALVYVIGGASLSLRYQGFGLPGQQAAALTPREVLLAAGLRTLALWAVIGLILLLALRLVPDDAVRALASRLRTRYGVLAAGVLALALFLLLKVWWPLAGLAAVLAIILASVYWESRPVRRFLISALSIGLVAVAYEADRISYLIERTCVLSSGPSGARAEIREQAAAPEVRQGIRVCGILVGQQDRGFYLGVDTPEGGPYRLVFVPAPVVEGAYSATRLARVIPIRAEDRREPLRSRLWSIRVR
jgi:hypothetical protein